MRIDTLIGLVRETSVGADGKSFDRLEQSAPRQVFAAVKSVTRAEFYAAFTAGMSVDIVFELLAYTAEKERRKIRTRQAEGIKLALQRGAAFGRPSVDVPKNFTEVTDRWRSGEITAVEAMRQLGLKKTTFYKLVRSQHLR